MTRNQISYWELIENKRANLAREGETFRHNRATEQLNLESLRESARHNLASEDLSSKTLEENKRHNIAYLEESRRHNIEYENIERERMLLNYEASKYGAEQAAAATRAAAATSASASRYATDVNRDIRFAENMTTLQQLDIRRQELTLEQSKLTETQRSNKAREAETHRANLVDESISKYAAEWKVAVDKYIAEHNYELGSLNAYTNAYKAGSQSVTDILRSAGSLIGLLG